MYILYSHQLGFSLKKYNNVNLYEFAVKHNTIDVKNIIKCKTNEKTLLCSRKVKMSRWVYPEKHPKFIVQYIYSIKFVMLQILHGLQCAAGAK